MEAHVEILTMKEEKLRKVYSIKEEMRTTISKNIISAAQFERSPSITLSLQSIPPTPCLQDKQTTYAK
jgi:hypothetical protein